MKNYIIFDLEATCYNRNNTNDVKPDGFVNEIIEIGALKVNENGDIIDEFSKFLKPKKFPHISNFCNELTTIEQKDIDFADNAKTVLESFCKWSENCIFVSWGYYDKKQLKRDLKINNLDENIINTSNHISIKHEYAKWNNLRKKGIGLGRAIKREGLVFEGTAHRGIDDARNILRIFKLYK